MAHLRHIQACNSHDAAAFWPFAVNGRPVGYVRPAFADRVAGLSDAFRLGREGGAPLLDLLPTEREARTRAVAEVVSALADEGLVPPLRGEDFPVVTQWGQPELLRLDRAAVPGFGVRGFGLHVNGYVPGPEGGIEMWVGRRARDRGVAPGKLDNMVAGGQPAGLTLTENLVKEAREEAGLDPALARRAQPVGAITYVFDTVAGLRRDTLFCYDLALSRDVIPRNTDGEVEGFELWPLHRVADSVRTTDDWKFNVNLVIIDFLIRHGRLTPDDEPDYMELVRGLRSAD
ncbi:DUF4743 domain-containing protein [Nitrospirillum iridis]|uniref:8-oxo-dGTP pyrophosphatase MutT (NUDIX family) n=1 Tax=Nitrospirillum iridis TaxID=765888 RepID=A0A7X0EGG2_9PROT|nr:DUF4743 domain-containing protein [Nitrospirillum iridis]MBB6254086.1 8-oxo-dGTP pyrophosphatase MutT (NUDIX family) [Nitrospirillum iridis]